MATHCAQVGVPPRPGAGAELTPTAVRELLEQQSVLLRLTVHELRRPLAIMDGYLSMMRDGSLGTPPEPEQADRAVLAMAGAVREMAALVDGLAAVARREDRTGPIQRRRRRLDRIVAAAAAAVEIEAHARRTAIAQDGVEIEADVDQDLMRVAVVNLLANAVQHSPADSTVNVTTQDHGHAVSIAVTDLGSGVDPADAAHLFDPWFRGATASEGLGLGLWIVREVVEWHGGRVAVDSTPGRGSTFSIVLPSRLDDRPVQQA